MEPRVLAEYLRIKGSAVDAAMDRYLPPAPLRPGIIHEAMRYSALAPGKRLRPILVLATAEMFGVPERAAMPVACALEFIHAYSLVHDDLPCMDNDDYRRGRPTSHRVFGEAIALLAGDALLTLAFELLGREPEEVEPALRLRVLAEVAMAAGTRGMIGGQVEDLAAEGARPTLETLLYIHSHKTGALFRACARAGALLGNASPDNLERITRYGECFGLAFQIVDDILDHQGSDLGKGKATFPALLGLEEARSRAAACAREAREALQDFGQEASVLRSLTDYIVARGQ